MNYTASIFTSRMEKRIIVLFALIYTLWSAIFIFRTSFVAIDGRRYFCLFDDAMVSMRYAWNFSHGAGLVWNAGERVQGYTNLLTTLIMSVATLVFDKSIAALAIQILGVGFMLAIAYANMKIAERALGDDGQHPQQQALVRILSFVFALFYYPLNYWSLTGMETGLLAALLLFAVLSAFNYAGSRKLNDLIGTAVCLSLAFLTRNDSLIFALLIWGYIAWSTKMDRRIRLHLFLAVISYLAVVAGQFLFQYWYYGELLPNTYTLKLTGMSLPDRLSNGLGFTTPFLIQVSFLLIPAIIGVFLQVRKEKLLLLFLFLSAVGYQIYVGGDPWNYWRMMSPTLPVLGILFIDAVNIGVASQTSKPRLLRGFGSQSQIALIALIGMLVVNAYFLPEALFLERPFYVSANQHNVNIALALREVTTSDATLGLLWAGAIPYFAERNGIDFLGKSDRYIAHLQPDLSGAIRVNGMKSPPGHNKYDLDYSIKSLQPTYVQEFQWGRQDLSEWAESRYVRVEYKGTILFLRKDSPAVLWDKIKSP